MSDDKSQIEDCNTCPIWVVTRVFFLYTTFFVHRLVNTDCGILAQNDLTRTKLSQSQKNLVSLICAKNGTTKQILIDFECMSTVLIRDLLLLFWPPPPGLRVLASYATNLSVFCSILAVFDCFSFHTKSRPKNTCNKRSRVFVCVAAIIVTTQLFCNVLLRSSMVLFRISFDILRWFITSFEISLTQLVHRSISKSRAFKKGDEWYFEEVVVVVLVLSGGGEVLPISISSGLESL